MGAVIHEDEVSLGGNVLVCESVQPGMRRTAYICIVLVLERPCRRGPLALCLWFFEVKACRVLPLELSLLSQVWLHRSQLPPVAEQRCADQVGVLVNHCVEESSAPAAL